MNCGFVTGSYAYGAPRPDSDIDLVVLVDTDTQVLLQQHSADKGPIRFGKLNLIAVTSTRLFEAWARGTDQMIQEREETGEPVSRDRAVEVLTALRAVPAGTKPS